MNPYISAMVVYYMFVIAAATASSGKPNFVFILTDDMDQDLHSLQAMPKLRRLITRPGRRFVNAFVTTPVCCVSRAVIFSGRYMHSNRCLNNTLAGGCYGEFWRKKMEPTALPKLMKDGGYKTFFAGKYLNRYGQRGTEGTTRVPAGWDWWIGIVNSIQYCGYPLSVNGTFVKRGYAQEDYITTVLQNYALEFLKAAGMPSCLSDNRMPFFLFLAPTAPHWPAHVPPQFARKYRSKKAPKTPAFGAHSNDKHWFVKSRPGLSREWIRQLNLRYRKRLRSLRPVDNMVENIHYALQRQEVLNNTYIMFASDNGYHLGQFNMLYGKRQPYEFDIRVPLMVRGPGVQQGVSHRPVLNLDWAPTILDLAGLPIPDYMEGLSMKQLMMGSGGAWRKSFLVEYNGESESRLLDNPCAAAGMGACKKKTCVCLDSRNNTYSCLRTLTRRRNDVYCEFQDEESFVELYDLTDDRHQLTNMAKSASPGTVANYRRKLRKMKSCKGQVCRKF